MHSSKPPFQDLPAARDAAIEAAVKQAALHLLAERDAECILCYYASNPTVVSDGVLYPSFDSFAADIKAFYGSLRDVTRATWDEMRVDVLSDKTAAFTGRFSWTSTDTVGETTDLRGVWTAVFIRAKNRWKIKVRHESFARGRDDA